MSSAGKRKSLIQFAIQQEFTFAEEKGPELSPPFKSSDLVELDEQNQQPASGLTSTFPPYRQPGRGFSGQSLTHQPPVSSSRPERIRFIEVDSTRLPVTLTRHGRAKHYLLKLHPRGSVSITVPRGGTLTQAYEFLHSRQDWVTKQWRKMREQNLPPLRWGAGSKALFRGEVETLMEDWVGSQRMIVMGEERMMGPDESEDWRPYVESYMRFLAGLEFPHRTRELATEVGLRVNRVTVRNQRSRWGSCSSRGNIALNWRLIQAPPAVLDYVIYHELAHIVEMNHSRRFWNLVKKFCADYEELRSWLKQNARLLGM